MTFEKGILWTKGIAISVGTMFVTFQTGSGQWNNDTPPPIWSLIGIIAGSVGTGMMALGAFCSTAVSDYKKMTGQDAPRSIHATVVPAVPAAPPRAP